MATQSEVKKYVENQFEVEFDGDFAIMGFDLGEGRSQKVIVLVTEDLLVTSSPFASTSSINDSQALAKATSIAPIWKTDEYYATAKSRTLDGLDPEEITSQLALTCYTADALEKEFGLTDEF